MGYLAPADVDAGNITEVHPEYTSNESNWKLYNAAYRGTEALIDAGHFPQHPRESAGNYTRRKEMAISYNISRAIIDLFIQYLYAQQPVRDLGKLENNALFQLFQEDADFYGTDYGTFMVESTRWASVYGHVGVLVDAPTDTGANQAEAMAQGLYPYCTRYTPLAILDWYIGRQATGRPRLEYLKLADDDGHYRVFWPDMYQVWRKGVNPDTKEEDLETVLVAEGETPAGVIPFTFLAATVDPENRPLGISDLVEIALMDKSIMANLSQGEEIIDLSAFPMMRLPMKRRTAPELQQQEVGPTSVLEFDPEDGEAGKPDWLQAECNEPLMAIDRWIDNKIQAIYRAAHAESLAGMSERVAKSGVALKREFMELAAKLSTKAQSAREAEQAILGHWASWAGVEDDAMITYPQQFDVEDLETDLANMLTGRALVPSKTFAAISASRLARRLLPDAEQSDLDAIDAELAAAPVEVEPNEEA